MEQKSINFLKMTSNVIAGMDQEKAVWENEPEILKKYNEIKLGYETSNAKNQLILSADKTGFTIEKDNLFDNITQGTHKLVLKLSAYAKIKNDHVLLPFVDLSLSALSRGPEKEAVDRCGAIIERAVQMLPQLAMVKITTEQLEAIKQQIADYKNSLTQRSTLSTKLSVSNDEISKEIASIRINFDILDDLIEGIIEDEGFIARYKSWRKIPGYGKGKTLKNPDKPTEK
jgi:hypothetical protein